MDFAVLTTYGWLGFFLTLWIGLSVGSFLNVVIYRYPIMLQREWEQQAQEILAQEAQEAQENLGEENQEKEEKEADLFNLAVPRSACPNCGHQITALENIPVFSWLFLRGKCSSCKTRISARYPLVELATAMATLMVISTFGFTWLGLYACLFTWLLVAAFGIDYDTQLLPDQLTYPILWLGLIANMGADKLVPLPDAVIGAIAGYLFLWGIYWIFKLLTGKEGMGYGDFKLFAALGAWMGWQMLPNIILIAAVLGLIYALTQIVFKKQERSQPIPFGPFLAIGGWTGLVFGEQLLGLI
ncbi:MAG: A24 family peptidase [Pseudomonadota bacterium]